MWLFSGKAKEDEKPPSTQPIHVVDIADGEKQKKKKQKKARSEAEFNNFVWLGGKEGQNNSPPGSQGKKSNLYPSIVGNTISNRPFVTAPKTNSTPVFASPYDILKRSSCQLNPKIQIPASTVSLPPALVELIAKTAGRERIIFESNFEREVIEKLEEQRDRREKEAEERKIQSKSIQEALLKEWLEQQTRKQHEQQTPQDGPTASEDKPTDPTPMQNDALVDLHFSPRNSPQMRQAKIQRLDTSYQPMDTQSNDNSDDLPPPYPGPPASFRGGQPTQHQPPATIQFPSPSVYSPPPVQFPSPPPYGATTTSSSHGWPLQPPSSSFQPPMTSSLTYFPSPSMPFPYPSSATQPPPSQSSQPPPHYHALPKRAQSDLGAHPRAPVVFPAPTSSTPMYDYVTGMGGGASRPVTRNLASSDGFTHTTTVGSRVEDYVKKYPVLASSANRKKIFMTLVSGRQLDPDIVATALEIYPENEEAKVATFSTHCQKYVQLGYPLYIVKQALLLYETEPDSPKCIAYLKQFDQLLKMGFKEAEIFDAFSLFENDVKKANEFLLAYQALQQFGFDDVQIREALLLHENNRDKAAQYLANTM